MTTEEARAKVAGEDWKAEWDHPQIIAQLISEPMAPTLGEILPYEFDLEDENTGQLLRHLNGKMIERTMREHILSLKKQEVSRMHLRFGPFTI